MTDTSSFNRTFDFEPWRQDASALGDVVRTYAAHPALRSAQVEELELDDEFHRRALRPEDLSFIDLAKPVTADSVTQLPFLAVHRLLSTIHDLGVAGLPRDGAADSFARAAEFGREDQRALAARILPFLEAHAFDFLETRDRSETTAEAAVAQLGRHIDAEARQWGPILQRLEATRFVEQGLRFALIQHWALAPAKRTALARAAAARFFEPLGPECSPRLIIPALADADVKRLALQVGVKRQPHSYWQFYLSTSLASCNLLNALARRPDRALRLYGAAFAAEGEWLSFGCLVERGAQLAGLVERGDGAVEWRRGSIDELTGRFGRALGVVDKRWGPRGVAEVIRGLELATTLGAVVRRNLGEQLRWLSSVETYQRIAQRIDARIAAEWPDIDRDTFVEPREMCSTTHVHDDHRLVVIESGHMVFWGNPGMTLRMAPGEMVLVPQGRLHGSSIESDECVYHQPIIPEAWVRPLLDELDSDGAPLVA